MVIIELIDFTNRNHDEFQIQPSASSSEHTYTAIDNIQYLLNLLKLTIRSNRRKNYSLQFELIGKLESSSSQFNYDIVISDKYNLLITTQTSLVFYNRILSPNQMPIPDSILFKIEFADPLRCLKLIREQDEEFIYVSTSQNTILKCNLGNLLQTREPSFIWQSEKFQNCWGIEILNDRIYIPEFDSRVIVVLDCESGKRLDDGPKLPSISSGFQLIFISPEEMIISHDNYVELFHLNEDEWKSVKKTSFPIESAYSMFYERESQLIYLSDSLGTMGEKIKVINSKDLSLVKSFDNFNMNFGICIDRLSGLLYVCDTCKYYIEVFK